MIPKKIHYCWFGGNEKPKQVKRCIESWKKYCPDYELIEWNENNFDLDQYPYLRWCHDNRKWAFLSDFARLLVIKRYGGFYFDTDVELLKSLDNLLNYEAFYGFENSEYVNTGEGFGAEEGHPTLIAMIREYAILEPDEDGTFPLVKCPELNTNALLPYGLELNGQRQNVGGAEIFPKDFFNPYDDPTGRLIKTENTISIHWYSKSWMDKSMIIRSKLTKPVHRLFGVDALKRFRK